MEEVIKKGTMKIKHKFNLKKMIYGRSLRVYKHQLNNPNNIFLESRIHGKFISK
jgi:hypothetical protein